MTAMMATKNNKQVDEAATNNKKEYEDEVQALYLVTQMDIMQHFLCCTMICSYQVVTGRGR